jgi:hypothetical protein
VAGVVSVTIAVLWVCVSVVAADGVVVAGLVDVVACAGAVLTRAALAVLSELWALCPPRCGTSPTEPPSLALPVAASLTPEFTERETSVPADGPWW